jgi:hypothetical protein
MNPILQLECRTGPMPGRERWTIRFGDRAAYERARARSAIRHLTRACMSVVDGSALRTLLEDQKAWRSYLKALG